ncbi:MAG: methyltransferase domain-containing protein [Solirubrobacteraceae bacterium]|nr:methyltransferase domain-containing protein [Solirubrobacteraceae bacterium]
MSRRYLLIAATFGAAHAVRHAADRLAALDPEAARTVVALDGDERTLSLLGDAQPVITGEDLGLGADLVGRWAAAYGRDGILWAALPYALAAVGEPGEHVLWIGEEVEIVGTPTALWDALDGAVLVAGRAAPSLAPYANERADNAKGRPHAVQPATAILRQGGELVARSVLGWRVGDPAVAALLAEWPVPRDRPTHEEIASPEIAQQWFNGLALHDDARVLGDGGLVLSPAQLLTRTVEAGEAPEVPLVDGAPLTLLALRGFDPHQPHLLEGKVRTARVSDTPAIAPVLRRRAEALLALGWEPRPEPVRWTTLPDGYPVSKVLRGLIRAGMRADVITRSPFTPEGAAQLDTWLQQPARQGGSVGVNRFLEAVHKQRKDLHAAYPSLDGPDGLGYLGWAWVHGRDEMGLPERWLPPRPAFLDAAPSAAQAGPRPADTPGVNVAGYLTSELGLGESARQIAHALEAGGVPSTPVQGLMLPPTRQQAEFQPVGPDEADHDINVIVVNGEQMPGFAEDVGPGFFEGRPSIGVWWWEVDPFPAEEWGEALAWLDEIWVGTDFIRGLVEPHVDVPVWVFPVPVSVSRLDTPLERSHFGFGEDETVFLYMWDYHSTEARKNPSGLVDAYRRAFPDPAASKTRLVLKCVNHESVPEADEKVRLAAAGRDDIQFIDRFLSGREKNGLLELCDCFVSPHRSEGFGYSPAEAMLLGKPVVVTAYGGTTQYTDESVARMVRWTPTRVGEGAIPYPPEGTWAEPDLDDLAGHLRWIVEEPEAAAAMALRGQERVRTQHDLATSGRAMRDRLEIVRARAPRPAPTSMPDADPASTAPSPAGAGRRSRKQLAKSALRRVPAAGKIRARWWRTQDQAVATRTADLRGDVGELRRRVEELSGSVGRAASEAETQRAGDAETTARIITGVQELQGVIGDLTRRVDDHLLRHSIEPYGIREAGFSVTDTPGIGRALGGTDLVSTGDNYADFLSVFRGPYDRVKEIMEVYGPLLAGHGPLLDIGCGRGELMEVAEQAGVEDVRGIDLDAELIEQAKARGRNATAGDGIAALRDLNAGDLGSVTAIHVLEHLDVPTLEAFFSESIRTLRPGGVLAIETINPHEVSAASTFWVDPTHHGPLFPEVALALALSAGFASAHVFAPDGTGDWDHDRTRSTRYTLLARSAG